MLVPLHCHRSRVNFSPEWCQVLPLRTNLHLHLSELFEIELFLDIETVY